MAVKWGEAEIEVHVDGSHLPAETEQVAKKAGGDGGKTFSKSFDKNANSGLKKSLSNFSKSFKEWDKKIGENNKGISGLSRRVRAFGKTVGNTEPMLRFRLALSSMGDSLSKLGSKFDGATTSGNRHGSMWKRLSANTRQWTLIVGAVIGSLGDLAGLGSAAGSGIFILAGALGELIAGGGLAFVAFSRFLGDIEKVPAAIKPARKAFDQFGKSVGKAMDEMAVEAFKGTEGAWKHFGEVVKDLQPGFNAIGKVVNGLIQDLSKNLDTKRVERLNKFLSMSGDVLDRVVRMVGRLADGLLTAFTSPAFQRAQENLLGWLDGLIDKFTTFLTGPGFDEWLRHGEEIFGALGGLLETTGTLLNNMVTDETVKQLTDFITHIDDFLANGGKGILDFAQKLDVFGLLAQALDDFGFALEPLAGPMADLAEAINDVISAGIDKLAPIFEDIAETLAPFVQEVADFMKADPKRMADLLLGIAAAFVVLKGVKGLQGVAGKIGGITQQFKDLAKEGPKAKDAVSGAVAGILTVLPSATDGEVSGDDFVGGLSASLVTGFLVGGPVGAALSGFAALVTLMISDMVDENRGPAEEGWDQIFDPTNYEGAGIGPIKRWFHEDFATAISEGVNNAFTPVTEFFGNFNENTKSFQADAVAGWESFWADVHTNFETGTTEVMTPVTTWLGDMNTSITTWWADVKNGWATFWGNVGRNAKDKTNEFTTGWDTWLNNVHNNTTIWWGEVKTGWSNFWTDVATNWRTGVDKVKREFGNFQSDVDRVWRGVHDTIQGWVNSIGDVIRGLFQPIQNAISWFGNLFGAANSASTAASRARDGGGDFASGGILTGPRRILAGEAGPEAIVPLRRSLSQVNPTVRQLSAIAQGLAPSPAAASSAPGGPGRVVNISQGAIVIQGVRDPNAAAVGVVNRIAERIAG